MNLFKYKSYFTIILIIFIYDFLNASLFSQNIELFSLKQKIETSDTSELKQIYHQLSKQYQETDLEKTKFYSHRLLSISNNDNLSLIKAYINLASCNGMQMNKDSVQFYLDKAISCTFSYDDSTILATIPDIVYPSIDNRNKVEILNNLTKQYFYNKSTISEKLCLISLELAKKESNPKLLGNTYRLLGFVYSIIGNYKKAHIDNDIAYNYFVELSDTIAIAFTLNLSGLLHSYTGENDISLSHFLKAENYYLAYLRNHPINDTLLSHLSILYTNMGLLYSQQLGKNDTAEKYFNKVLDYSTQNKDTTRLNAAYANLGMVSSNKKEYKKALSFFNKALDLALNTNNLYFASRITHNIGDVYKETGDLLKSIKYYKQALSLNKSVNDIFFYSKTNRIIGNIYYIQNKNTIALQYYYIALKYSQKTNSKNEISLLYKDFSELYSNIGNIDSSFHYYKLYSEINNEVNNEKSRKRLEELEVKYETEKTISENLLLKKKSYIQKRINLYLIISLTTLSFLLILLFYFFRTKSYLLKQTRNLKKLEEKRLKENIFAEKQINKLQEQKLKHKYRELSTATLQIINKNNILANIAEMIKNKKDNEILNDKICKIIKDNLNSDKVWKQFKLHFEEVHSGFFDKLITNYPNLSHNDLKLCAYIRINLSSKEIAQMLQITSNTVNKNRYLIRKKLNLNKLQNLDSFIREI